MATFWRMLRPSCTVAPKSSEVLASPFIGGRWRATRDEAVETHRVLSGLGLVHQFLVVLSGTNPLVWRRILAPEKYSF